MKYSRSFWETELFLYLNESRNIIEKIKKKNQNLRLSSKDQYTIRKTMNYIREVSVGMTDIKDSRRLFLTLRTLEILDKQGVDWARTTLASINSTLRRRSFSELQSSLQELDSVSEARKILDSYCGTLDKIAAGQKVPTGEIKSVLEFLEYLVPKEHDYYLSKSYQSQSVSAEEIW